MVAIGHCWWATYPVFQLTQMTWFNWLAYDSKAVPMFAVLSGFLIYRSVLGITTLAGLREYAIRRFFRVYPVYFLGIILCLLSGQYVGRHDSAAVETLMSQVCTGPMAGQYSVIGDYTALGKFISDVFMLHIFNWPTFANPPTWSLYIEVVFYALLPLIVLTIGRKRMVPFALVLIVAMLIADYAGNQSRLFTLWKYFLIGIVASEASKKIYSPWLAYPVFIIGCGLLYWDFGGPTHDWFADLGFTFRQYDNQTVGLGIAIGLMLTALPHVQTVGRILNILPIRLLGIISYSVYITHFFYIQANFPEIGLFTSLAHGPMYEHFQSIPMVPNWYLPFIFFPGVYFWGLLCFLLVERPGMRLGSRIVNRARQRIQNNAITAT